MKRSIVISLVIAASFIFSGMVFAEDKPVAELEKKVDTAKAEAKPEAKPEAAAEAKAEAKPEEAKAEVKKPELAPEPEFPVDERKLKVTIKMKSGKTVTGIVKHFLVANRVPDFMVEPDFMLSEGPTIMGEGTEYVVTWQDVKKLDFNKKNRENGEVSCVEDYDKSPERKECVMINEYSIFPKSKKGSFVVQTKEMFRIVFTNGKKVDLHLGKVKITNERDEQRSFKNLSKQLQDMFKSGAVWMKVH